MFCNKMSAFFIPDNYIKLVLIYENAATFYIQKLIVWEGFKVSPDVTVATISLEKTRFLLNQELKSCRDQNINALEGGKIKITFHGFIAHFLGLFFCFFAF